MSEFFDEAEESRRLARLYLPYVVAGYREGIEQADTQTGKRAPKDVFDEQVKAALKRKAFAHAVLATGTTKKKLQTLLLKAIREGWGVQLLADKIDASFDVQAKARPLTIARTELTESINAGIDGTLKAEGFTEVEWSTVIDGAERESHHAANGQVVGVHELFKVGNSYARYPGDENLPIEERANCRCVKVGAGLPENRKRAIGQRFLRVHGSLERKFVVALRAEFAHQKSRVLSLFPS